jgi:two-component system sensor histidine kinase EvgS
MGEIQLIVTDVIMPEMNGRELVNRLQAHYSGIKTLYISGYTADAIAHRGVLEEGVHFLSKPFTKRELAVKVKAALGLMS